MDFAFNEEQQAVKDLAAQILQGTISPDRLKELRANGDHIDRKAWQELANAELVGIAIPEAYGGGGLGFLEACLVLEQVGRNVAPVPYYASVVLGALPVAQFGTEAQKQALLPAAAAGDLILTAAILEAAAQPEHPATTAKKDGGAWKLTGQKDFVAAGVDAGTILVSASTDDGAALFIVDPTAAGVSIERQDVTNDIPEARITLDGAAGEWLGGADAVEWTIQHATAALCATAIGVCDVAVKMTAEYTS